MIFHKTKCIHWMLVFAALALLLPGSLSAGGERDFWRAAAGLRVFPSMLAADMDIAAKAMEPDGEKRLLLVLLYVDRKDIAEELARHLRKVGSIRGLGIRVEVSDDPAMTDYTTRKPAGIYLTQKLGGDLQSVMAYGRLNQRIVFSPFESDVERGVPGGIIITDKILPYINIEAMKLSEIEIKPFFLKVATLHD